MRICQSCGRENADDRDFCDCGEYLRWDPTGFVQAVTPEMAAQAAAETPPAKPPPAAVPPPPVAAPAQPPTATPFETYEAPAPALPPEDEPTSQPPAPAVSTGGTLVQSAVPAPPPPPAQAEPEKPAMASITLRLPDEDSSKDELLALGVDPGGRERLQALVRNQSGIVDNYELKIRGLPDDWYTIFPNTLYLVPFGTGGTYEQQVEIHLHPPRSPAAEARLWDLELVANSKAYTAEAATAPFVLGIQPFEQFDTKIKPERASGRRKVRFQVAVENKANAPVRIGFEGVEPDNECKFSFGPQQVELPPGQTTQTTMTVKPPKQIWIGRPHERRIEVKTHTGENADLLEAQQASADEDGLVDDGAEAAGAGDKAKGLLGKAKQGVPGVHGPQVAKGGMSPGGLSIGQHGVNLREPVMRQPRLRGPRVQQKNIRLDQLKIPSRAGGAPPPVTGPLLPTQAVFRQKSWLPWWLAVVVPLLAVLALFLFLFLPKTTKVPQVVGSASAFAAEKTVTESGLTLNPTRTEKPVSDPKQIGTVLDQTPKAGEKATKGKTQVSIVVGVGDGKIEVPNIVGKNLDQAEKALRDKGLTVGKSSIQPPDPKAAIASQIPAAREVVKQGTPVDIFYPDPKAVAAVKKKNKDKSAAAAAAAAAAGAGGGAADIVVPAIADQKLDDYANAIGKLKLVPKVVKQFNNAPKGTLFATKPEPGTKVKAGQAVTLLVSAGFPEVAFDNDKNVLLISGANGSKVDTIAKGPKREKDPTWSFDGTQVAFQSDGQIFLKDTTSKKTAIPLTDPSDFFKDLSWAPTGDANVLAMLRAPKDPNSKDPSTLCFGQVTAKGMEAPSCLDAPKGIELDRTINWAPNGKSLMVFGFGVDQNFQNTGEFGMVRYRSKKPFSPDKADWSGGKFITDHSQTNKGVLDAAISPDGKTMAVVENFNADGQFRVETVKPNDPLLQQPKPLNVIGCKAIWLPDNSELLVVQSDDCATYKTGVLMRVPLKNPQDQRQLKLSGDNPSYQPLTIQQ